MEYVVFSSLVVCMVRICIPLNFVGCFDMGVLAVHLNDNDAFFPCVIM